MSDPAPRFATGVDNADPQAHHYCARKLASARSPAALALIFAAPRQRGALGAVHALELELREVAERSSEPGVGRARSAWWAQEIAATVGGRPTHPVTRVLASVLPAAAIARAGLDDALEQVAALTADGERGPTGTDAYARALGGASVRLSAAACDCPPALAAGAWGDELGRARLVVDVALAGRTGMPTRDAAAEIRAAIRAVPAAARAHVADQLVLATVAARSTGPHGRPGPLTRLLIAWRAARRARRPCAPDPSSPETP